ncbi:nitrate- and nitrite sensing domain-containing protein [Micromonospora sp. NPDC126480]|uniref:sensor histidine kinase n=1 Tax=Micromonospora sp. NPDC126480 TaxID=3155312 RepID=UPI0033270C0E
MSKRPKTAGSFLSRLRRPAGRLRDMPIWSKLGLIMIVPTIATVVVGTSGLIDHLQTLNNANRAGDLSVLVGHSGDLVHRLQDERTAAIRLLGLRPNAPKETRDARRATYEEAAKRVDEAKGPYSRQRAEVEDLPSAFESQLRFIDRTLTDLPGIRSQVLNARLGRDQATKEYEQLLADLLNIRDSATQLASDTELSDRMRAATALARNKEYMAQQRDVVHEAIFQGQLTPDLRNTYISTYTGQLQWEETFKSIAGRADQEYFEQTVAGPDSREAISYNGNLRGLSQARDLSAAGFTPDQWNNAMTAYAGLFRQVEARIDGDAVAVADDIRSDVQRQVFLETGLLLSMLLLAILFAYLVARSMARSLRDLRQGALSIAQYGLPQAVARLRDPQVAGGQLTPVQLANQIAEPLPVRSKDEFGQVTEAFNAVHLEAVRTAAEQAALRASVATMFVNLARRSQILVDRLIGHLDRLERGEEDPDRLAELFQLDHLATRMRRNDENLLVLAGADSTRVQREPAALIDVLRAAQSEVEHYTRIEFGVIDRDIEVAAHAVNDLVHLVAELFDNATAFSPPDSQVVVEARRVGDRASLYVEDRGIGISPDQLRELNEKLATPPQVDVAVSRMMGLVVVARLASRHGVKVELRPGADRGTVADVTLPTSVLVPRVLAGRPQPSPALPPATTGPAPAFGALPALGNAPAAPVPGPRPGESGNQVTFGGRSFDPGHRNGAGTGTPAGAGAGRAMPAWSDLTGATAVNGVNGADTYAPRTSNGQPVDPLPQRRNPGDPGTTGQQPGIPRQLPSSPEAHPYAPPQVPPVSAPPVPPVSAPPIPYSGPPVSSPPTSGMPVSSSPVSASPVSGQPISAAPASGQPYATPLPQRPVSATPAAPNNPVPPAWPPVSGATRDTTAPAVPERVAAALDMTTELPRVARPAEHPGTPAPHQAGPSQTSSAVPAPVTRPTPATPPAVARPTTPQPAQNRQRYADETMELPIFRELESAWFRTRRPGPEEAAKAKGAATNGGAATQQFAKVDAATQQTPPATTGNAPMAETPTTGGAPRRSGSTANGNGAPADGLAQRRAPAGNGWQTAADDGWRAASAASEVPVSATTNTGLPKRTPMAQLVPGAVEKPTTSVQRRTPESVRGLLSAYHRGVQRGRSHPDSNPTSPEATPGGQSSQSGSGPVAGSGQKEQEG